MKNLFLLLFNLVLTSVLVAQVPGQINYQGVARSVSGNPLPNQQITLRLSIRDASASGNVVYQETRSVKTSGFGLFSLAIGSAGASNIVGSIQNVNWSNGNGKYLQVEIDPKGGNLFTNMGSTQLLSVPFALHAAGATPSGQAGGSLQGTYPAPILANNTVNTANIKDGAITDIKIKDSSVSAVKIQNGAVGTDKIADQAITSDKLAAGLLPASLPPSGTAGGDLTGSYPDPQVASGAISTAKIADGAVVTAKIANGAVASANIADNAVTTSKISAGAITSVKVADNAITSGKIADGAVITSKYADGSVTTAKVADGAVSGVKIADAAVSTSKISDAAVTSVKIADAAVSSSKISDDAVTSAKIADGAVLNVSIADGAISTVKIENGAVTAEKLAPGLIVGGSSPTGSAGGDLSGNYPNPTIASGAITQSKITNGAIITPKIADGAVSTGKIADGAVTLQKLASGIIPTSLPPSGTAAGDLSGTYPNPTVAALRGKVVSSTAPASGQVLKYNGTQWEPATDNTGSFSLPYSTSVNSASSLFNITNPGAGNSIQGTNSSTNANAFGVVGSITSTSGGASSSGVRGINNSTGGDGNGIWGSHDGAGSGIYGTSVVGPGLNGFSGDGYGAYGNSTNGIGIFGTSETGIPGFFNVSNTNNYNDVVFAATSGYGNGLVSISTYNNGVLGIANDVAGAGVFGINNAGGEAVLGRSFSDFAAAVVGRNDLTYAGVKGVSAATNGTALLAQANVDGADNGTALVAELAGGSTGNLAVFAMNGSNVARIDHTGKGYFNNGTQVGGADVAEFFDVEGLRSQYEPGDVLVISMTSDRKVEKSSEPYSTLVSGVYATKAGLLLTEHNAEKDDLQHMVPMGVIGVIPTKVNTEGGAIKRGDMLVTSSVPGVAMKADPEKVRVGQVLGKSLQDFNGNSIGKINVLVSVK